MSAAENLLVFHSQWSILILQIQHKTMENMFLFCSSHVRKMIS